jgi:hypothetical protein
MLDRRAWIITGIILVVIAGAYVLWFTRPRAGYNARSLSASGHPANSPRQPATTNLHVEGCREDFLVKPGEIVEPKAAPGASLDQFLNLYGPETKPKPLKHGEAKQQVAGIHTWDLYEYTLTAGDFTAGDPQNSNPQNSVHFSLKPGHVLETLDDVELGIDSMGTVFRKMRDRMIEVHETIERTDGNWTLRISIPSACGRNFRSEYSRTLPSDPETDRQIEKEIASQNTASGGKAGTSPALLRSDMFMNKVVSEYTLSVANGNYVPREGSPSEHE